MKLAIISHTGHYRLEEGTIVGLGSTVREIEYLSILFDQIYHLAPLHTQGAPASSLAYKSDKIHYKPLIPIGGKSLKAKISIIRYFWQNISRIHQIVKEADVVHFRAPTSMGIYILPYLSFYNKRKWIKYAGNWKHPNPSMSAGFQRWWLKNNFQKSKVTINGVWPNQKPHLLSFENPCVTDEELNIGKLAAKKKRFDDKISICFVGRLEKAKGVEKIINALELMEYSTENLELLVVGEGEEYMSLKKMAESKNLPVSFLGTLSRNDLNKVYEACHIFCLPSSSEGFPKVLAEAAAYGCIPVVSNVSAIGQYISSENGILLKSLSPEEIAKELVVLIANRALMIKKSSQVLELASMFTYKKYVKRIKEEIIGLNHNG